VFFKTSFLHVFTLSILARKLPHPMSDLQMSQGEGVSFYATLNETKTRGSIELRSFDIICSVA
jgi:hypothetical protein